MTGICKELYEEGPAAAQVLRLAALAPDDRDLVGPAAYDHQNRHEKEDHVGDRGFVAAGVVDAGNDHEQGQGRSRETGNDVGRKQIDGQNKTNGAGDFKDCDEGDDFVTHAGEAEAGTEGMHNGLFAMSKDFAETGEQKQGRHDDLRKPEDCAHG